MPSSRLSGTDASGGRRALCRRALPTSCVRWRPTAGTIRLPNVARLGDSVGRMGLCYTGFVIPLILPFRFWDKHGKSA